MFKNSSDEDLTNFNINQISNAFKISAPLVWKVLTTVASGKTKEHDLVKVITAASVLLHSRSKFHNKFQHAMAISMYNNHLQKEGFQVLSKIGISVGHSCLNRTLNKAQTLIDEKMMTLRKAVEDNKLFEHRVMTDDRPVQLTDHDYIRPSHKHTVKTVEMIDHEYSTAPEEHEFASGYRFNFDNLDFLLRVRNMTTDHQNKSKHYVQIMAVKDRVNCEHLPDDQPIGDLLELENNQFLPSLEDHETLRNDLIHAIAILLIENVKSFKVFEDVFPKHFQHEYSDVMSRKSVVVIIHEMQLFRSKTICVG